MTDQPEPLPTFPWSWMCANGRHNDCADFIVGACNCDCHALPTVPESAPREGKIYVRFPGSHASPSAAPTGSIVPDPVNPRVTAGGAPRPVPETAHTHGWVMLDSPALRCACGALTLPDGEPPAPPAEPVEVQRCATCGRAEHYDEHDDHAYTPRVEARQEKCWHEGGHRFMEYPPLGKRCEYCDLWVPVEVEDEAQRWRCVECGLAFSEARPQGHERMTNAGPYQCGPVVVD